MTIDKSLSRNSMRQRMGRPGSKTSTRSRSMKSLSVSSFSSIVSMLVANRMTSLYWWRTSQPQTSSSRCSSNWEERVCCNISLLTTGQWKPCLTLAMRNTFPASSLSSTKMRMEIQPLMWHSIKTWLDQSTCSMITFASIRTPLFLHIYLNITFWNKFKVR